MQNLLIEVSLGRELVSRCVLFTWLLFFWSISNNQNARRHTTRVIVMIVYMIRKSVSGERTYERKSILEDIKILMADT